MAATCVIGLQWGDEAKGKIVDFLTSQNDVVVRYQGGANAGHTVVFDGKKYKLSLIPSGVFRPEVKSVIASGVVIDPESILGEIDRLRESGVEIEKNLFISERAHVIFPWHKEEDRLMNEVGGRSESIGTTLRGIGPWYARKILDNDITTYMRSCAAKFIRGEMSFDEWDTYCKTLEGMGLDEWVGIYQERLDSYQ